MVLCFCNLCLLDKLCMLIKNSPLLTCAFYTFSALGCSHSLHYPVAAEDTSDKMEGLGKMHGDFTNNVNCMMRVFLEYWFHYWWCGRTPVFLSMLLHSHQHLKITCLRSTLVFSSLSSACCLFIVDIWKPLCDTSPKCCQFPLQVVTTMLACKM